MLEPASDAVSTRIKVPSASDDSAPTTMRDRAWPAGRSIRIGDMIGGRYRVERLLGAGGMGQVVEALHVELERVVAVKVLHDEWAKDEDSARRFVREARVVATLSNEHVVRIFDLGRTPEGAPYIVMERLEGKDLGAVLEERGPVSILEATEWVAQASEALSEAHQRGIVHRDVKPQNLFLARLPNRPAPVLKVLDFGLAKNILPTPGEESRLTGVHMLLGSPHFMSPEQIRDARGVDSRTDVWSLGATLFQLLTREPPFVAKNLHMLCAGILTAPIPSVRTVRPEVPEALDKILARCLARNINERYASAKELALELRAFLGTIDVVPRDRGTAPFNPPAIAAPRPSAPPRPAAGVPALHQEQDAPTGHAYPREDTKLIEPLPMVDAAPTIAIATPQQAFQGAPVPSERIAGLPDRRIPFILAGTLAALLVAAVIFAYRLADRRTPPPPIATTAPPIVTAIEPSTKPEVPPPVTGAPLAPVTAAPPTVAAPKPIAPAPDLKPHFVPGGPKPHPSTTSKPVPSVKPAACTDAYACP
jgi:eukaryotic-like serine/threonine-protein kinase